MEEIIYLKLTRCAGCQSCGFTRDHYFEERIVMAELYTHNPALSEMAGKLIAEAYQATETTFINRETCKPGDWILTPKSGFPGVWEPFINNDDDFKAGWMLLKDYENWKKENRIVKFSEITKHHGKKIERFYRDTPRLIELQHEIGLPGHWAGLQEWQGEKYWITVEPDWLVREMAK